LPSPATKSKYAATAACTRLLVLAAGRERRLDLPDELVGVRGEQRLVELQLAGEVLVEHRLADARALGDVVHRGSVVALVGEDVARRVEQLGAPGAARDSLPRGTVVSLILAAFPPLGAAHTLPVGSRSRAV
jgi:hypothetical protein